MQKNFYNKFIFSHKQCTFNHATYILTKFFLRSMEEVQKLNLQDSLLLWDKKSL